MKIPNRNAAAIAPLAVAAALTLSGCSTAHTDIDGLVIGKDDDPRSRCAISPAVISGGPIPELAPVSGPDGTFGFELPPGSYEFTARCADDEIGSAIVEVGPFDRDKSVVITVSPQPEDAE
ncbi:hypothetical protein [Agromyces larvae]|uniref:Carboxypeptidase regulatory-like domain-containing protein n=1 Tax=Agromyces larvae TaxID=2929802 RepID=A0ABY4BVK4_9MICO|nr:hypothetical protein [Agromyces larvae]UOE43204.1 hypothetical protein MTO99_13545 [Agromyces larvae]